MRVGVVLIKTIAEIAPDTARRRSERWPVAGIEVRNENGVACCVAAHLFEPGEAIRQMHPGLTSAAGGQF